MKKLVVDCDGTLFSYSKKWPEIGEHRWIHKIVAHYVRYKKKQGWITILNTMREPYKGLELAKEACIKYNIPIDLYNENYKPDIEKWGESRKIGATVNIDDMNIGLIGFLLRTFSK